MERTLCIIKPDAVGQAWFVERGVLTPAEPNPDYDGEDEAPMNIVPESQKRADDKANAIIERIEQEGFSVRQKKRLVLSKAQAKEFYSEHADAAFYDGLTDFMSSGPIIAIELEKEGAIGEWRKLMGPTNSVDAREAAEGAHSQDMSKWTIRALYGIDLQHNAVHGSDSHQSAQRELQFMFPEDSQWGRTLCLVLPDAVKDGKTENIVKELEGAGFVVVGRIDGASAAEGWARGGVDLASGPVVALAVEKMSAQRDLCLCAPEGTYAPQSAADATGDLAAWFPAALDEERTLALIKPQTADASHDEIVAVIRAHGFDVIAERRLQLSVSDAQRFYAEHNGKRFFKRLTEYMSSGPVFALVLAKPGAIKGWRSLMGPTNTFVARSDAPGCLRALFGIDATRNACHGSDSPVSALREIGFFFPSMLSDPLVGGSDAKAYMKKKKATANAEQSLHSVLTKGLTELCKAKPAGLDGVAWLGKWLLAHNASNAAAAQAAPPAAPVPVMAHAVRASLPNNGAHVLVPSRGDAKVVFVLGGPGSGKGTQCQKIVEKYGYTHLSAGDLLRAEVASGSPQGEKIQKMMEDGELVPVETTLALIEKAMKKTGERTFLIDGFPRDLGQAFAFEQRVGKCDFVLYFDCPEEVMNQRLLARGETSGRVDDNSEAIVKRFRTFRERSVPVIDFYKTLGKVREISAVGDPDDIFNNRVSKCFDPEVVFVLGGPGSGKGTVCGKLATEFGYTHLSAGDVMRDAASSGTADGQLVKRMMSNGQLVPVKLTMRLLKQAMDASLNNRFLLDGFPRNMEQAVQFEKTVAPAKFVLHLDCPREDAKPRGGRNFKKRWSVFKEQTSPVLETFKNAGAVRCVDSSNGHSANSVYLEARKSFLPELVVVLGGPGSGVDEMCGRVAGEFGYTVLAEREILSAEMSRGSREGLMLKSIVQNGQIIPVDLKLQLICNAIRASRNNRFVLNNFPRTVDQARAFSSAVGQIQRAIFLDCTDEEMLQRCDALQGEANDVTAVQRRIRNFKTQSMPVVESFARNGLLTAVNAAADSDSAYRQVRAAFQPSIVVVIGPTGSGKRTQGANLAKAMNAAHLDFTAALGATRQRGTPTGQELKNIHEGGGEISAAVGMAVIREAVVASGKTRFILDGFPRSKEEATLLQDELGAATTALFLDCAKSEIERRAGEGKSNYDAEMDALQPVIDLFREQNALHTVSSIAAEASVFAKAKRALQPRIVVLCGADYCGQDALCTRLGLRHGYGRLQTASLLEDEVRSGSANGKAIQKYQEKGQTVPSDLVVPVIRTAALQLRAGTVLLEGFPRVISAGFPSVHDMVGVLEDCVGPVDRCLVLNSNPELMKKRVPGKDEKRGAAVKNALALYRSEQAPVAEYFHELGKATDISTDTEDADAADDAAYSAVLAVLEPQA